MSTRPAPKVPGRVFITGANGFIARSLAARLRELGARVTGVDLTASPSDGVVVGSTVNPAPWAEQLTDVDVVVHTAAIVSNAAPLDTAWEVNVLGTQRVLRAAIAAGVTRFVHVSSIAAYGFDFADGVDETDPVRVSGYSYVDTKVNSEHVVLAADAAGEIATTIIRPGDVWGPASRPWTIIPLEMIAKGQMILPAHGRGVFSPAHVDNLVDGMVLAIASERAVGQIFNLTDGFGIPCSDYFGRLAAMAGGKVRTLPTPAALALTTSLGAVQRRLGMESELTPATIGMLTRRGTYSIEKARTVLGYQPIVSLDDGMTRVAQWARGQGLIG
ncbi:NAD-dependent epimerase/dehydratase family protein [Mycolicibacterium arenosum]|uniref:NAD-dependent epimerase/dehydratase family protein n=1 Tax=Mycolicibacterium arenosum TaxID=2952157 RepID=A0ABT1LZ41_9MYCO|nr:NAD-dependent epimerase/dehydratase family protein [Mycolicibacterium sp. CAU 1645]MCP9271792.1 NAD-dependent epimerase/dehydratase family protein [Mycolicibacterium sp. CAU 1645]